MLRIDGKIYTGLTSPAVTDGLLVGDDGVIVALGEDARRQAPAHLEQIALGRRVATPGFIDAHAHLEFIAEQLTQLSLDDASSLDNLLERVAERTRSLPADRPVMGVGWDESDWPEREMPTCQHIDRAAPTHAVCLRRIDGHLWTVNSEMLRRMAARDDLSEDQRRRLEAVSRDGILREGDIALAAPLVEPTAEEKRDGLLRAMRHAATFGVTCAHDVGKVAPTIAALDRDVELPIRVVAAVRPDALDASSLVEVLEGLRGRRVTPGPVKLFLDGSIGAQTAAVSEPFADDPGNTGQLLWEEAALEAAVDRFHVAGLQLALHAIGDRAIRQALDVLERVLARHPRADHRHRIEHVEIVTPDLIERMAKLGVIASMQPNFVGRWQTPGGLYDARLGSRRERLNPLRSMLSAGVPLAFGSDCMPFGALYGIASAVNHTNPAERLSFVEALHAYTFASAFAGRIEHLTGSIEVGKQADLIVLSGDPAEHADVKVEEVFVAGRRC